VAPKEVQALDEERHEECKHEPVGACVLRLAAFEDELDLRLELESQLAVDAAHVQRRVHVPVR